RRGRVAGFDPVVVAFGPRGVARQAVLLAQRVEVMAAAGQHLVHVRLMARVEDDRVVRRIEYAMKRQRELDHAEVGPQMPAGGSHLVDQVLADFVGEVGELPRRKGWKIWGPGDLLKHPVSVRPGRALSPAGTPPP